MSTLHNHVSNINNNLSNINNNNNNNNNNQQSSPQATGSSSPSVTTGSPSLSNNNNNNSHPQQPTGSVGHPSDSFSNIVNNNNNSSSSHTTPSTTTSTAATTGGGGGILGAREVSSAKKFLPLFARSMMMSSASSSSAQPDAASAMASADGTTGNTAGGPGSSTTGGASSGAPSGATGGGGRSFPIPDVLNVVLHGYQRKLKTNKKKYFVVYGDTPDKFARLEYFDSEKKFKQSFAKLLGGMGGGGGGGSGSDGGPVAKRSIVLRSCFNINKRHDTKKHIIALFTKDDCFCIVFESEDEMNRWLRTLLRLQRGEESEGDPPRPTFEHVWDVFVQRKGLGDSYGILGTYRLCITDKILSLVRIGPELTSNQEKRADLVEFSLASIRRCGHSQRYFYLEVGRSSKTGAGEIWMELQDSIIAQNMYTTIMKSAKSKEDNLGPMIRIRSSSANAASKPTSMLFRRQTHAGQKPMNCSPSSVTSASSTSGVFHQRALSLPSAPMLGHSPHSNTNHLSAIHGHSGSSARSSSQSSVVGVAGGGGGGQIVAASSRASTTTISTSSVASSSFTGTIQPVHHRTRSLPLTEESAIRITSGAGGGGGGWWGAGGQYQHQHHYYATPSTGNRKSSSSYLLAPPSSGGAAGHVCSLHGATTPNGCSPPMSELVCTSPQHYEESQLLPSRSSMESIIEDQRYLPMDLKKPAPSEANHHHHYDPNAAGTSAQLQLISRLLRSSNLQSSAAAAATTASTPASAGKIGLIGLKMAMMAQGAAAGAPVSSSPGSSGVAAPNGCSCSSPSSSQCSSSSNCVHAISSPNISTHKSTNGSSPAALRRPNGGGRAASSTISRSVAIARERCDSLPSRNRTTSETMPHQQQQQQQLQQLHQHQSQQHQLMLNSGGMPPPRMIPSNNRPHSMHISSCHGHSPPVNSSPLSPPPATYSTGSDGSSYSIDESTDSFITDPPTPDEGNGYKVINHLNSGGSIPEENSEEFIKDYGHIDLRLGGGLSQHDEYGGVQASRRGGSPAPPSTVGSVEGSAYMEMCSPSGSSPGDPSGSCYMAMSPVADFSRGLCSSSSAHSRASSLAEDLVDGYVPMSMPRTAAQPPTEEYVSMDPTQNGTSSRLSNATSGGGGGGNGGAASGIGGMSSAASSCSITSGTPSTDLRLSLEKVPAYIGQSDEGEVNDRPYRTYSVGSRPEHIKRKLRIDMLSSAEGGLGGSGGGGGGGGGGSASSRQRAFSVGSRAKVPRCSEMYKGYSQAPVIVSFVSSSSQGSVTESNNNSGGSTSSIPHVGSFGATLEPNLPLDESAVGRAGGSGSLLAEWKPPFGGASSGGAASHGSFDQMADLMEIDYSSPRNGDEAGNSSSTPLKRATTHELPGAVIPGMEDYLDMSGSSATSGSNNLNNNNQHQHQGGSNVDDERERAVATAHALAGYVEMRPGGGTGGGGSRLNSQSEEGDYLNMTPGVANVPVRADEDVVDGPLGGSAKSTSNPIQISSPKKYNNGATAAGSSSGMDGSAGKNNNYLDMYPRMLAKPSGGGGGGGVGAVTKVPSEDYLNMTPLMMMSSVDSGSEEKMLHEEGSGAVVGGGVAAATGTAGSMDTASSSSAPDGYMEMSFNHNTNTQTGSNAMPPSEDYMNMSFGTTTPSQVVPSAPITITPGAGKCRLDLSGESKVEASSNIPNYLPLGHHHHNHHHSGKSGSHVSATIVSLQQPVQTTTGQQSGSVGFSPSKGVGGALRARCDSRDSGIVTPSGSQATIFPFSPGSPTKPFPAANVVVVEGVKQPTQSGGVETLEDLSQNYAELSLGRQQSIPGPSGGEVPSVRKLSTGSRSSGTFPRSGALASPGVVQPDYVNFCPVGPVTPETVVPTPQSTARSRIEDDGAGDYALMNPASARKQSTTSMGGSVGTGATSPTGSTGAGTSSTNPPVLVAKKSTFLSNPQMGFKPIASSQDAELLGQSAPSATKVLNCTASSPKAHFARRLDGVTTAFSFEQSSSTSSSSQPPLQRSLSGTRPNSVNSELIGGHRGAIAMLAGGATTAPTTSAPPGTSRPNSANSERLPIISATSSSASSTSTLCESKNQSPSASCTAIALVSDSRPDSVSSVTDPHIISRPPSVSSERELHYASLDLPPCTGKAVGGIGQPPLASSASGGVQKMDVDEPLPGSNEARYSFEAATSSPSPGCTSQQQPVRCGGAFTYAQIDFVRSQAPKQQQPVTGGGPGSSVAAAGSGAGSSGASPQSSQA